MICSTKKLFGLVGAAALGMVTAEGSALAQETCADGVLFFTVIEGDVEINGTSCLINEVSIEGNVTVTGSPDLIMLNNDVDGSVSVTGGERAVVSVNRVTGGDVNVSGNRLVVVAGNTVNTIRDGETTTGGNVTVNDNQDIAYIYKNFIDFDLTCKGNNERVVSLNVVGGEVDCASEDNPGSYN